MFRSLNDDPTAIIEPFASGASGDLMEIARAQDGCFLAVEFAEAGEKHGSNGDIDADAEGVGSADNLEETFLSQLFDQDAVFGEETGMMQTDAVAEPFFDFGPVWAGEFKSFQGGGDGVFFVACADIDAGEILGALGGFQLSKVDDVDGAFGFGDEILEGLSEGRFGVGKLERDGPGFGLNGDGGAAVQFSEFFFEEGGVPERGGHKEEPRLRESQQGHLPGDSAVAVGIIVELVHDHFGDIGGSAFAQSDV